MKKPKKRKTILIVSVAAVLAVLLSTSVIISSLKFHTPNVFSAAYGLVSISSGKSYQEIRSNPSIYLARPETSQNNLITMMADKGYRYVPEKRLGSGLAFAKGEQYQYVHFRGNAYYSIWEFFR